jgi:Arc/MetJ-type ribon-helix-helix transcriptional regulator
MLGGPIGNRDDLDAVGNHQRISLRPIRHPDQQGKGLRRAAVSNGLINGRRLWLAIADAIGRPMSKRSYAVQHHPVYNDAMSRTQVYLGEDELELLDRASRDTGASRSELIRRAVRTTFGQQGKDEKLRALKASAGAWRGRRANGAEYVDALRGGDLNERLARLGVK